MARSLVNKVNVMPPDSDYPYARILDDDGTGNGTPVDENTYGDFHQFFAKLFAESGLTYNELPDNDYTGFQYYLALQLVTAAAITIGLDPILNGTDDTWHVVGSGGGEPAFLNSWTAFPTVKFRKILKTVHVQGVAENVGSLTTAVFTLPAGYRPAMEVNMPTSVAGAVDTVRSGYISTNGNVFVQSAAGTGAKLVFYIVFTIL